VQPRMPKLKTCVKVILALVLIWILAKNSLLNFKLLLVFLSKPSTLIIIFSLMTLNVVMSAWRWYKLNAVQGINLSYRDTLLATYVGLTFNNLFLGSVGGDLIRVNYLFKRMPQQKIAGTVSVLADRICGLIGVFSMLCALGLIFQSFFDRSIYLSSFLTLCIWLSLTLFLFIGMAILVSKLNLVDKIQNKFTSAKLAELIQVIRIYKKSSLIVIECIITSMLIQVLLAYIIATIGVALSFNAVPFLSYTIANLITQLTSLIPISPGGLGVGEMAFAKSIVQLSGRIDAYATIYLAYRILTMVFSAPGVLIFLKINQQKSLPIFSQVA